MAAQRTGTRKHSAQPLTQSNTVNHGDVAERLPTRAEQEDTQTKAAYGIPVLRSCYLTMLDLPTEVGPGDHALARSITSRIDRCIEVAGRWTPNERRRLYRMRKKWEHRASGRDVGFNLRGWQQMTKASPDSARERDRREAHTIAKLVEGVRQILGDN